jgi:hypothetical protein
MRCKHYQLIELVYQFENGRTVSRQHRCDGCGEWLPLGPANNSGPHAEAVAIEIAAAIDAQQDHDWSRPPIEPASCMFRLPAEDCSACQQLWLAYAIATHDDRSGR